VVAATTTNFPRGGRIQGGGARAPAPSTLRVYLNDAVRWRLVLNKWRRF
jgi:hypothetical protein